MQENPVRTLKHPSRLLITLAVAACASSACARSGGGGGSEGSPRRDANLITRDELDDVSDRSVLEVIQVLRPQWLRRTGFRNGLPSAVLDNQRYELDILETMSPDEVFTIRFVSPSDASIRWGTGYPSGVIELRTRQR
jgi:hypothetical protein